jgi:hypothetical protein
VGVKKINPALSIALEELRIRICRDYERNFKFSEGLKLQYFSEAFYPRLIQALGRESIGLSYLEVSELTGINQSKISNLLRADKLEGFVKISAEVVDGYGNVEGYSGIGLPTNRITTTNGRPKKDKAIIRSRQKMIKCKSFGQSFISSIVGLDDDLIQAFNDSVNMRQHASLIRMPNLLFAIEQNKSAVITTLISFQDFLRHMCIVLQGWRDGCQPCEEAVIRGNLDDFIDNLTVLLSEVQNTIGWIEEVDSAKIVVMINEGIDEELPQLKILIVALLYSCRPALDAIKPIIGDVERLCPNGFILERKIVSGSY